MSSGDEKYLPTNKSWHLENGVDPEHPMDVDEGCRDVAEPESRASKKRRVDKLKAEVAKQYTSDDETADTDPKKGFVTMHNRRMQNERAMRDTQNMIRRKRKEKAADKAAEPKPRGSVRSKKNSDIICSLASVDVTHEALVSSGELSESAMDVYTQNYHEFLMRQANSMVEAEKLDEEDKQRREREMERKEMSRFEKAHRTAFKPTLELIGFEVPHGTTSTVRGVVGQPKSNITSYFGLRQGSYTSATERKWRRFYHERVKTADTRINVWPECSPVTNITVGSSSSGQGGPMKMFCNECNVGLEVDMKHGNVLCPVCGITKSGGEGVGVQVSFAQQQSTQKGAAPYERIAHVSEDSFIVWVKTSLDLGSEGMGSGPFLGSYPVHSFVLGSGCSLDSV